MGKHMTCIHGTDNVHSIEERDSGLSGPYLLDGDQRSTVLLTSTHRLHDLSFKIFSKKPDLRPPNVLIYSITYCLNIKVNYSCCFLRYNTSDWSDKGSCCSCSEKLLLSLLILLGSSITIVTVMVCLSYKQLAYEFQFMILMDICVLCQHCWLAEWKGTVFMANCESSFM